MGITGWNTRNIRRNFKGSVSLQIVSLLFKVTLSFEKERGVVGSKKFCGLMKLGPQINQIIEQSKAIANSR